MVRLPQPGDSNWGTTLNNFLLEAHNNDGSLKNSDGRDGITRIEVLSQNDYNRANKNNQTLYIIT
jgi:hypothetical protein